MQNSIGRRRYKYYAFLSYQSDDREWATWLHTKLEQFHLPTNLGSKAHVPRNGFKPLFLDQLELAGGNLSDKINNALADSRYLLVLCSPTSAKSEWVEKEVRTFIESGRVDKIVPIIISGVPYAKNPEKECFVPSLRALKGTQDELLGIDAQGSKDTALIKIVAELLGVSFDTLWQRHEREKEKERQRILKEKRRLQRIESSYLVEKSFQLLEKGYSALSRRLALEALPVNLSDPEDRPYVQEAEMLLRTDNPTNVKVIDLPAPAKFVAVSPDKRYIAVATDDFNIMIWNHNTGRYHATFTIDSHSVNFISFTEDSKSIIVADDGGCVRIWHLKSRKVHHYIKVNAPVISVFQANDEKLFWILDADHTLSLWGLRSGTIISRIFRHESDELELEDVCPIGPTVSSISSDKIFFAYLTYKRDAVCLVELNSGELFIHKVNDLKHLAFNPCNECFLYAESLVCHSAPIFEFGDHFQAHFMPRKFTSPIVAMRFDRKNNYYFAFETGEIVISDSRQYIMPSSNDSVAEHISDMAVSADGSLIAVIYQKELRVWDRNHVPETYVPDLEVVHRCRITPDGNNMILISYDHPNFYVAKLDVKDYHLVKNYKDIPAKYAIGFDILPDGSMIYVYENNVVRIDHETGNEIYSFRYEHDHDSLSVENIGAADDYRKIYFTLSGDIYIHNVQTSKTLCLKIPSGVIKAKLSNDGKRLFVNNLYGMYLWDIKTNTPSKVYFSGDSGSAFDVAPDGKTLAVAMHDYTLKIVNIADGTIIHDFEGHSGIIISVQFSQDGEYLISTSADKTVKVWKKGYKKPIWVINSRTAVDKASFSPDMKRIAYITVKTDLVIREFPTLQELIDRYRDIYMKEPLTLEERKQFYID